ncbi:SRPBCC domain-containing protein [Naumannella halotolerans]|uniref:Uncharacterized protein YndB with AHSA1/START domain n=1 Tax=Naumannella halotolerans TaxID=993414 RepID=A0A4R7J6B0_9ACTN|nr:SRPBCC domain-containing protein [Naumannella halotolerans]TDT32922.1 uncharacterized protein YndB with AHSA1/START domain [Naumannella halotolerans]
MHEPDNGTVGVVHHRQTIDAPVDRVWEALTTPGAIGDWWGHPASFPDGMVTGATGTFELVGEGLMPIRVERAEPPRQLTFWWGEPGDERPGDTASRIDFTLSPGDPAGTEVLVTERLPSGSRDGTGVPDPTPELQLAQLQGWQKVLGELETYLRRG